MCGLRVGGLGKASGISGPTVGYSAVGVAAL